MKLTIATMVLMAAGCAAHPFVPAHAAKPENAFGAAVRVLIDDGQTIEMKDESAGVIVTKWEDFVVGIEDPDFKTRIRWKVTIGDDVTVVSQCQNKDTHVMTHHDWQDCTAQPDGRSEKAADLAKKISETHVAPEQK